MAKKCSIKCGPTSIMQSTKSASANHHISARIGIVIINPDWDSKKIYQKQAVAEHGVRGIFPILRHVNCHCHGPFLARHLSPRPRQATDPRRHLSISPLSPRKHDRRTGSKKHVRHRHRVNSDIHHDKVKHPIGEK